MTTVGEAIFQFGLDPSKYYEEMEAAKAYALRSSREIQSSLRSVKLQTLTIRTDERALTGLNRHLDKKAEHVDRLNRAWKQKPLTPQVDLRQFDQLERRLSRLRSGSVSVGVNGSQSSGGSNNARLADEIGKAVARNMKPGVGSAIGSVAKIPLQLAGGAAGSIASGLMFGLTQELTQGLGKGISTAIEGAIGKSVGSSELLGEKLAEVVGKAFSEGLKETIGKSAVSEAQSALKDAAEALVPQTEALFESGARARRRSLSRQAQRDPAREQLQTEKRDLLRERTDLRDRAAMRQQELESLPQRRDRLQTRASQLQQQVFDQTLAVRSASPEQQGAIRQQLRQTQQQYAEALQALNIIPDLEESIQKDLQELERDLQRNGDRIQQTKRQIETIAPEQMPKAYREAVQRVSGGRLREDQIPQLQVADAELAKRGSRATYDISTNTIKVTQQLYDSLHDNRLEAEQLVSVLHELSHAADFGFGSAKGERAFDDRTMLRPMVQPTPEELQKVAPLINRYSEDLQPIEMSAEVNARRVAREMLGAQMQARQQLVQVSREANRQDAIGGISDRGRETDILSRGVVAQSRSQIKVLSAKAKEAGLDIAQSIAPFEDAIETLGEQALAIAQHLARIDGLSPDELRALEKAIDSQMSDLEEFAGEFARIRKETVAQIKRATQTTAQQPLQMPVNLRQAELVPVEVDRGGAIQQRSRAEIAPSPRTSARQIAFKAGEIAGRASAAAQSATQTALQEAAKIEQAFSRLYGGLQQALKEGNRSLINQYGQALQEMADSSKASLTELGKAMQGEGAKFGDSAFSKVAGLKGRLTQKQNLAQRSIAKFNRDNPTEDKSLDQIALTRNPLIEGARSQARSAINKLNALIAKQYEVEMRSSVGATLGDAIRSPRGIAQAKDLAVNTAGFAASKGLERFGIAPELAGDLIGALAMRQAMNVGGAGLRGAKSAVNDPSFKAGNALEKFATIVERINNELMSAQFSQMQSEELFGDLVGFGIGNAVAKGGEALGIGIPMKGAAVAMATVPRLATMRERINARLTEDDEFETKSLDRLDLNRPNQRGRLTDDQRKALQEISKLLQEAERHADSFDAAFRSLDAESLKRFTESSDGLERVAAGLLNAGNEAKSTNGAIGLLGLGLKALLAFQIASFLVPQIAAIGTACVDAAQSLEQLEAQFEGALGADGAAGLEAATQAALDLKVNLDQARQTYLQFASATQGTPLESIAGDGAQALLTAARMRGMTPDQVMRSQVALSQMASKGTVSAEEVRGQLAEAMPGSTGIMARSMGMSVSEFNAQLNQGGIQSADLLPKFFAQLQAESTIGASGALDTTAASVENLNTQIRLLQEEIGKPLLPVKKLGLDALASAIEGITSRLPALVQLIGAAMAAAIAKFTASTIAAAGATNLLATAKLGLAKAGGLVLAFLNKPAMSFAGLTVGIMAAIDVAKIFTTAFSDLGGSASKTAEEIRKAREAIRGFKDETKPDDGGDTGRSWLGETAIGAIFGRDNVAALERGIQQRLGLRTFGQEEFQGQQAARADAVREAEATIGEVLGQIQLSRSPNSRVNQIRGIDAEIRQLQTQRGLLAPEDNDQRRAIDSQVRSLSQRREGLLPELNKTIAANNVAIEGLKKLQAEAEKVGDTDGAARLAQGIEAAQKAQEELNKIMRDTVKTIALIKAEFDGIQGRFQEAQQQITMRSAQMRAAVARSSMTAGQREFAGTIAGLDEMRQRIEANNAAIERMNELLNDTETQRVLNAAGFNNESSPADIRQQAATMPEGSDRDRLESAAQQIEAIRGYQLESAQLEQQIAESTQQAGQRIRDLTRQVTDFYRGLGRQTEDIQRTIAGLRLEAEFARTKAAINRALGRFRDTFFDEFIGGVETIADLMNQIAQIPNQAAQQIAQLQQQIQDAQLQGQDLTNQLPNGVMVPGGAGGSGGGATGRTVQFQGIQVTSAVDASGEPGLDYVVSNGQRGAEFGSLTDGKVVEVVADQNWESHLEAGGTRRGYGNRVIVRTLDRVTGEFVDLLYAHLDRVAVQVGQEVGVGTVLGTQGRTGSTTGAHVSVDFFAKDANYASSAALRMRDETARTLARNPAALNQQIQRPVAQPARPQQQAATPARSTGGTPLNPDRLFGGGSNSLAARVVGVSEGTRTASGGMTDGYAGHRDYGNRRWNIGSFSYQHGARDGNAADASWNQRLRSVFPQFQQRAQSSGLNPNDPKLLFNFLDLYTQAPLAATGQGGFLDQLPAIAQGRSIIDARMQAYVNPATGRLDAPGFDNDPIALRQDQERRMAALETAISAYGLTGAASGIAARAATTNAVSQSGMPSGTVQNSGLINQGTGQLQTAADQQIAQIGVTAAAQSELLFSELNKALQQYGVGIDLQIRELDTTAIEAERNRRRAEFEAMEQTPAVEFQRQVFEANAQREDLERSSELDKLKRTEEGLRAAIERYQQLLGQLRQNAGTPPETLREMEAAIAKGQEGLKANQDAQQRITEAIKGQSEAIQAQIKLREEQYRRAQQQAIFEQQQRNFDVGRQTVQQRIGTMRSRPFDFGSLREANTAEFELRQSELMSQADRQRRETAEQLRLLEEQQKQMPTAETQTQIDLLRESLRLTEELNNASLENYRREFEDNNRAIAQQERALQTEISQGQLAPMRERSSGLRAMGFETQARSIDRELAMGDVYAELSNTLAEIQSRAGLSAEAVRQLTDNAYALANVKLDNVSQQFSVMGQLMPGIQQSFQGFFSGLLSGTTSLEDAFKGLIDSILSQLANLASQMLVNELFGGLFGIGGGNPMALGGQGMGGGLLGAAAGAIGGMGGMGGMGGASPMGGGIGGGLISAAFSLLGGIGGFKDGGIVNAGGAIEESMRQLDNPIGRALRKEGVNSKLAALTPGELVLTTMQTQKFFELGYDQEVLNYKNGGIVGGNLPRMSMPGSGSTINVNVPITMNGDGNRNDRDVDQKRLGGAIQNAVISEINRQKRPGGALYGR